MKRKIFTVFEVNRYIKHTLEDDLILSGLFVEGEISNFKAHTSGHLYFTLKDDHAAIQCVMFKNQANSLRFDLRNGLKMIVFGRVSLYEKTGNYQVYIDHMEPAGKGNLALAYEQLKNKLETEGLFDPRRKKAIPSNPKCIALITSPTGAAVRDMITVCKRRNKGISLVVVPAIVQGAQAAPSIVSAIEQVERFAQAEVIILGRGGGSMEDLWAFNEECVARAIAQCSIPIISAVGHETDFTISDFVADLRAATPSAAAEIATSDLADHQKRLALDQHLLIQSMHKKIAQYRERAMQLQTRKVHSRLVQNTYAMQLHIEDQKGQLQKEMMRKLSKDRSVLENKITLLESVSPLNVLRRGYAVVQKGDTVITQVHSLKPKDEIKIHFSDGIVFATVYDNGEKGNTNK